MSDIITITLIRLAAWAPVLLAVLAAIYRLALRPVLVQWLAGRERETFYAAVKFGLRVASALGLTADELVTRATATACGYLEEFSGLTLDEQKISEAILAEMHKLWLEEQRMASVLGSLPEIPAPVPPGGRPEFSIVERAEA